MYEFKFIKNDKHCPSCGKKKSIKLVDQKQKVKLFPPGRIVTTLSYECSKCGHTYKKKIDTHDK